MRGVRHAGAGLLAAAVVVMTALPGLAAPPAPVEPAPITAPALLGAPAGPVAPAVADPGNGCATPAAEPAPGTEPSGAPTGTYAVPGRCELAILKATAVCMQSAPVLDYAVEPTGTPNDTVTITWIGPEGQEIVQSGLPLSGHLIWPGTVIKDGVVVDWPGWTLQPDGTWVPSDEFDFIRPVAHIEFEVNPTAETDVSYPSPTSACAGPHSATGVPQAPGLTTTSNALTVPDTSVPAAGNSSSNSSSPGLATSGANSWPMLASAAVLVLVGAVLVGTAVRRQRRGHDAR